MRNSLAVMQLLAAIGAALPLRAQEGPPKLELYGGYDYVRHNANPKVNGAPPSESFNAYGVSGQIAFNPSNWLGLVAPAPESPQLFRTLAISATWILPGCPLSVSQEIRTSARS